jgi:hypothetical protein
MAGDLKDLIFRLLPRGGSINNEDFLNNEKEYIFNLTETISFNLAGDWSNAKGLIRAHQRILHSFQFIGDCLPKNFALPNFTYIKLSKIITNWHNYLIENDSSEMVFHDETTARRVQLLLKLLINIQKNKIDFDLAIIYQILKRDLDLLISDVFYAGVNNHGYFQDITIIYAARLGYVDESIGNKAFQRIKNYLNTVIGSDGVHKEHSPAYHYIIYNNVKANLEILEMFDKPHVIQEILDRMLPYARAIAMPNLHLPPIGDTEYKPISRNYVDQFSLQEAIPNDLSYFGDGGYAIIRDNFSDYYSVFLGAHHMNYHKHRDELELLLFYKGGWVLSESGPYGYDYQNFHSQYAYSNFGHNTLIINNEMLIDRDGEPGLVKILEPIIEPDGSIVLTGINKRIRGVIHTRTIKFSKSKLRIRLVDRLESNIEAKYEIRWHSQFLFKAVGKNIFIGKNSHFVPIKLDDCEIFLDDFESNNNQNYRYPRMYAYERGNVMRLVGDLKPKTDSVLEYEVVLT